MKTFILLLSIVLTVLTSQRSFSQMFWNQAVSLDAANTAYVSVRHSASLNIAASFTIEAWVNPSNVSSPSFQMIMQKRTGSNNDGYSLYLSNGKVAIRTNTSTRLVGKAAIPSNQWTHIAGTFNSATNTFTTYVNGEFDTSVVDPGAAPIANTDSLWIGKGLNSPFDGDIDEFRIWNRALSSTEVFQFRRTTLGSSTGPYSGLVLSLTFQDNDANGSDFSLTDWSGNANTGILRNGAVGLDQSNRPLNTIQMNDCIELDGSEDYLAGPDNVYVSPTAQLTLSAWIYLNSYSNSIIIHKGGASGGGSTNYRLSIVGRKLAGAINGDFNFVSDDTIKLNYWTYVVFTYYASLGAYQFHINGDLVYQGVNNVGNITDGTDSIYIGGTPSLVDFDGFIDEARIIPDVKYTETINNFMFRSIDLSNGGAGNYAIYNFDGYAYSNGTSTIPLLRFNGNSSFAYCGAVNNQPQSPLNRADELNFENGFVLKKSSKAIPETGSVTDSLLVLQNLNINDVNVFVTLKHTYEADLELYLIGPNGDFVDLFINNSLVSNADNLTTIFDDEADSSLVQLKYVSYAPSIKPFHSLNAQFSGDNSAGYWKLQIRDEAAGDSGTINGWGIQFNNQVLKPYILDVSNTIQGFYRPTLNQMIRDTMRYYLRNTQFPYSIYDSAKVNVTNAGFAQLNLANVSSGVAMYIHLKHRNSIETWSYPFTLDPLSYQAVYSFLNPKTKAFDSNMIRVDISPLTYGIYGADVNQDGSVDISDVTSIENAAAIFLGGYVIQDVNGDNFVDLDDQAIADNNSYNFVEEKLPPGALASPDVKQNEVKTGIHSSDPSAGFNETAITKEKIITKEKVKK